MTISPAWTAEERLALIQWKAFEQLEVFSEPNGWKRLERIHEIADQITAIATAVPEYLEANRSRLLEGVE